MRAERRIVDMPTNESASHMRALRLLVRQAYLADEAQLDEELLREASLERAARERIVGRAAELVAAMRKHKQRIGVEVFLQEYGLGTEEGIVLLCLAEALLRIPDPATADRLIQEKLGSANWARHLGRSDSLLVNASTWGLLLSGRIMRLEERTARELPSYFERLATRIGEPAVRLALKQAMAILGRQFVMGRTIEEALERSRGPEARRYRYSYDMLGEAALTAEDAARYFESYRRAIAAIAPRGKPPRAVSETTGISVKLSALHPRFEFAQGERVVRELAPRLLELAHAAREVGVCLTVDAEESERLEPTLDVFERVFALLGDERPVIGIAVQAYQKRARKVLDWLGALARRHGRCIPVRLVKGAYWDSEIKRAQERGLAGYPVFSRKCATDVSYLACAKTLLAAGDALYPQFATHNAHTACAILEMAGTGRFEFQRLHGMGEALYEELLRRHHGLACRIYAPVGSHEDLLPYLVRRLLENGANTSFLHHVMDEGTPVASLVRDPLERLARSEPKAHPRIPLPGLLYPDRKNSLGVNLTDSEALLALERDIERALRAGPSAAPLVGGGALPGETRSVRDPADRGRVVGEVAEAGGTALEAALQLASRAQPHWDALGGTQRAQILERAGDLIERDRAMLMGLLVREGGKCLPDADAEVREAADYCRYYAMLARTRLAAPLVLSGPTGEHNELQWHGRGVFACISPWNFPLAIFTGQVAAALAAGNGVLAKPANQTPLVGCVAVKLLHEAGIPGEVLHFLPGPSKRFGAVLSDPRLAGVALTGSTETGQAIARVLAGRAGPLVPLIAETGGLNAMIVDSSALPEQAVSDALRSAFNSAGQRCSALRVLFVQDEIAPRMLALLAGAMLELRVGDPGVLATDVGPVIDQAALDALAQHDERMAHEGRLIARAPLPQECSAGTFFAPVAYEISSLSVLQREVFGPVLHVVRYAANELDAVIDSINRSGYGLTLGIHTRIEGAARYIQGRAQVGNTYVNRNQIGAVVGVQPFGGEKLSGTGPKAGGPHYLYRFALERTLTLNTAAVGGNAGLLGLGED